MWISATKSDQPLGYVVLDQSLQTQMHELRLFLFARIVLRFGQQLVINIDSRPHAYDDACFICIRQANVGISLA